MAEDQLRTDEDVEAILRLAVQQSSTSSEDLRSRLRLSAAELGISEEQLSRAEEEYFQEKEEARLREEREARAKEERAQNRRERLWRISGGFAAAIAVFAFVYLLNTGSFNGGFFLFLLPLMVIKSMRGSGRRSRS